MDKKMRALIILYIFILLSIVDHFSTWILIDNNFGEETNPNVITDSIQSIFFSPGPLIFDALFLVSVALSEKYSDEIHKHVVKRSAVAPFLLLPLMYILMLSVVSLSNTIGILGLGTPLAWFAENFRFITEDKHQLIGIALATINMISLPILMKVARRIYEPTGNTSLSGFSI